jgi:hypothetical protein
LIIAEDETPERGSYTNALRNRFLAQVISLPWFTDFMPRTSRALPIAPQDLPIMGCYLGDEQMIPNGLGNTTNLSFTVNARLAWSVMIAESNKEAAERMLDGAYVAILYGIWCSQSITSFLDTTEYVTHEITEYNARFQSVEQQNKRIEWGSPFLNNETPVAELQFEMRLRYGREFSPEILHQLLEAGVVTSFPSNRTKAERDAIQQVRQELVFTTTSP